MLKPVGLDMSELILPFAIMALTILVALGLLVCFRKWLAQREQILMHPDEKFAANPASSPKRIVERDRAGKLRHAA